MDSSNGAQVEADVDLTDSVDWRAVAERYKAQLDSYRAVFRHVGDAWASGRAMLDDDAVA